MSNSHRLPHVSLLCAVIVSISACANTPTPSQPPDSLAPLIQTISERLSIADQVALTKWDSGKPIQDSLREQQVIANAAKLAPAYKLNAEDVSQFLAAQIEANKLVQYTLLANWRAVGKAPNTARPDLVNQVRPQLDRLQIRLLQNFADFAPYRHDPQCPTWLNQQRQLQANDAIHDIALGRAVGELCVITQQPR